jgi:hypothetical protein
MVNSHHTLKSQRNIINTQQTSVKRPLLDELNGDYMAQMVIYRRFAKSRVPAEVRICKAAKAQMTDLEEQIRLWKAMSDLDGKRLHEALCLRRFERKTIRGKS